MFLGSDVKKQLDPSIKEFVPKQNCNKDDLNAESNSKDAKQAKNEEKTIKNSKRIHKVI